VLWHPLKKSSAQNAAAEFISRGRRVIPGKFLWPTGFQHLLTPVKSISSVTQKSFAEIF
jgi:hypothetical protein